MKIRGEAIVAYRSVTADEKFKELERLRARTRHNEASALGNARRKATKAEREKWQGVVAEKDATIASNEAALADKNAALAEKDAHIAKLLAQLAEAK